MPVYVTQQFEVSLSNEPAVLISVRELERIIQRLDDYQRHGWTDLWPALAWAQCSPSQHSSGR